MAFTDLSSAYFGSVPKETMTAHNDMTLEQTLRPVTDTRLRRFFRHLRARRSLADIAVLSQLEAEIRYISKDCTADIISRSCWGDFRQGAAELRGQQKFACIDGVPEPIRSRFHLCFRQTDFSECAEILRCTASIKHFLARSHDMGGRGDLELCFINVSIPILGSRSSHITGHRCENLRVTVEPDVDVVYSQ